MYIEIPAHNDNKDTETKIGFTNEGLDSDDYIYLMVDGEPLAVLLDEVLPAVHAFEMKRSRVEYQQNNRKLYALK